MFDPCGQVILDRGDPLLGAKLEQPGEKGDKPGVPTRKIGDGEFKKANLAGQCRLDACRGRQLLIQAPAAGEREGQGLTVFSVYINCPFFLVDSPRPLSLFFVL